VQDPQEIRRRVELCNGVPTYLLTIAQRIAAVEVFASAPQQSDYSAAWDAAANERRASIAISPTGYRRIDETALLRGKIMPAERPEAKQPCHRAGAGARAFVRIPLHVSVFAQMNLRREYQKSKNAGFAHMTDLCHLMASFGSDKGKGWHNYTVLYDVLFSRFRNEPLTLFEVGIGTNKVGAPSSMGPSGRPGASLRAWRAYFRNAQVFAADVDRDILFEEDRIRTLWVDQRQSYAIRQLWRELEGVTFDLMIDDGLHEAAANIRFFIESFGRLKAGGIYVIEDVRNQDTESLTSLARCAAHACRCVVVTELPHPTNRIDNRLVIFQKT
jgi:hypothetical protein